MRVIAESEEGENGGAALVDDWYFGPAAEEQR
jgi:hypothetical protein